MSMDPMSQLDSAAYHALTSSIDSAGLIDGELRLNAEMLAAIYDCEITSWADRRLAALNPGLR